MVEGYQCPQLGWRHGIFLPVRPCGRHAPGTAFRSGIDLSQDEPGKRHVVDFVTCVGGLSVHMYKYMKSEPCFDSSSFK